MQFSNKKLEEIMHRGSFLRLFLPFFLLTIGLNTVFGQKQGSKINFQAQYIEVDKKIGSGAQRLIGDVVFFHNGAEMYCDSAYYYARENNFDAYSNILINQGDTVNLFGDFLHYDGNTKLADVSGNVKLINRETTLTTNVLQYDLGRSIGFYTDHATIINKENTLVSVIGYYYSTLKLYRFADSVVITTPDYKIYSDTVNYNTVTQTAYFFGPTNIIGDSNHIYCEKGWYDTKNDISELRQNAWAQNKNQTVKGDYIFYNKNTGDGIARKNVEIIDQDKSIVLLGNEAKYNEIKQLAFITNRAQFIQISDKDSLFLHADTLQTFPDSVGMKILQAYNHVKFYRKNVQGMCDSMVYTFSDSIARLYQNPVLWTENKQISAEQISMFTKNKQLERMILHKSSFVISQEDTSYFNQIKGKDMDCFFRNNKLLRIVVTGNGQAVYYAPDGNELIGVNKIECSNMTLHFVDGQMKQINFYVNPVGVLYPLDKAPENELRLKGFQWLNKERPYSRYDIF
jgi:lipopolysaccharide export system protein LptA